MLEVAVAFLAFAQTAAPPASRTPRRAESAKEHTGEVDAMVGAEGISPGRGRRAAQRSRLRAYLSRDLPYSARFLDHGVLQLSLAGGYPHRYGVGVALGLLDHLSLGVIAHWLPRQSRPRFAPRVHIAAYRWSWLELGLGYDRSLYPPPTRDDDPATVSFQQDAHWAMAVAAFSQGALSAGFEIGTVVAREKDPGKDPTADQQNPAVFHPRFGGGLFLRAGTRRWGFTASARAPRLFAELAFELRLGLFEARKKGGWRLGGRG